MSVKPCQSQGELTAALVDEEVGLCARDARFTEADVVEHLCASSGGRLTAEEIVDLAARFLASDLVVRLTPSGEGGRRRAAKWSTAAHRGLEDEVVGLIDCLAALPAVPVAGELVESALAADGRLGDDQVDAVRALTGGGGGSVRVVLAPAGYGKTAMAHAAATAAGLGGRPVLGLATTAKAVAGLTEAGLESRTIAQLAIDLTASGLAPGTVLVLDEISQTPTRDARTVLAAAAACAGGMLWVLGDARQSQPVGAGGVADEIERRAATGDIPSARLSVNRRQRDPGDREALSLLREGRPAESQQLRSGRGWEHEHATPWATREAMADDVVASVSMYGADQVAALAVSHGDAEDLADRIRARLSAGGVLSGPALTGPGWAGERDYRAGDRVLLHARCGGTRSGLINGTTATVEHVDDRDGLTVRVDGGAGRVVLPGSFVQGTRRDGTPNVSHGWARTVDGAQGGTWESCHLLGNSALDAFRGYSGQSRSRQPTHTWNTATITTVDHGGMLADRRSPAEVVAAALARQPDPRLAARSDPFIVDRQLSGRIHAHEAVLAGQPPDRAADLAVAEQELGRARDRQAHLEAVAAQTAERLAGLGARSVLTAYGRAERRRWQSQLTADRAAVEQAQAAWIEVSSTAERSPPRADPP